MNAAEDCAGHTLRLATLALPEREEGVRRTLLAWAHTAPGGDGERYAEAGVLGEGGMGRVTAVIDRTLGRRVARKELLSEGDATAALRFYTEAIVTSRLDHPAIPPVHEFGVQEGRPYFTMREVHGRSLAEVLRDAHGHLDPSAERRLLGALATIARAAGHAHRRGVVHRDIKPGNILLGDEGEIYLVDWGIALVDPGRWTGGPVEGWGIAGTPGYMAPEQARSTDGVGPWTDVFALGATLHEVIAGVPPRLPLQGSRWDSLISRTPAALVSLLQAALDPDPTLRPRDGQAFAVLLEAWLDGERAREEARALLARAAARELEVEQLRLRATAARIRAAAMAAEIPDWEDTARKAEAWHVEDEAAAFEEAAERLDLEIEADLQAAERRAPDLEEVHARLADRLRSAHEAAIAAGDPRAARRAEDGLRRHDRQGAHASWLAGLGQLDLRTDPPAEVRLFRMELRERRLVPVFVDEGRTPLRRDLPSGSWLAEVRAEGHALARVPFVLSRGGMWNGSPGGQGSALPIRLLPAGELGEDEVYVPAGDTVVGDAEARDAEPRRTLWIPGFICRRTPVTVAEYLAWLDALVAAGQDPEPWLPCEHARGPDTRGPPAVARGADGRHRFIPDPAGEEWDPRWPILLVDWASAQAFCAGLAAREARPWRLPWALEREKLARGADGRAFPWGEQREPTWLRCRPGQRGKPSPAPVGTYPFDESVYGARDLAGNAREWCLDLQGSPVPTGVWQRPSQPPAGGPEVWRIQKGGNWSGGVGLGHAAARFAVPAHSMLGLSGFRPYRSVFDGS